LYALKILLAHGLHERAIQVVFHSVILAQILHASPAWWGFARAKETDKKFLDFCEVVIWLVYVPLEQHDK